MREQFTAKCNPMISASMNTWMDTFEWSHCFCSWLHIDPHSMIKFCKATWHYHTLIILYSMQWLEPDPLENCHLNVKKNCRNLAFSFLKIAKNCLFLFKKIIIGDFFEKNEKKLKIFWKNGKFYAIFWHSNGNLPEG